MDNDKWLILISRSIHFFWKKIIRKMFLKDTSSPWMFWEGMFLFLGFSSVSLIK